jgi:arylsulfatase A-like enzyme
MIVITADHGQNFDNLFSSHSTPLLSDGELHVPLLIKYPLQFKGLRVDRVVSSTVDLFPTIMDTVGIAYNNKWVDGKSLISASDDTNGQRIIYARKNTFDMNQEDTLALIQGSLKIVSREGRLSIYNLKDDPAEKDNLLGDNPSIDQCVEDKYKLNFDSRFLGIMEPLCRFVDRINFIRATGSVSNAPRLK